MTKEVSHEQQTDPSDQDLFYESSRQWVLSLKERHDPFDYIGILENDVEKYPFQDVNQPLVGAYQPTWDEIQKEGLMGLQRRILDELRAESNSMMGPGRFDALVSNLDATKNVPGLNVSSLHTMWAHIQTRGNNVADLVYHPNILALPVYSAATAVALGHAPFLEGKFDLFEFNKQSLMPVNPALMVASFRGRPAAEGLSRFATLVKTVPPTRSALRYGLDPQLRRSMNKQSKEATEEYLQALYTQNKSAYLVVDPTASTFGPDIVDGQPVLRRKRASRAIKSMILNDFNFVWPKTMKLAKNGTEWYIGSPQSLFGGDKSSGSYDEIIKELDQETARLYGVEMSIEEPNRDIGNLALK